MDEIKEQDIVRFQGHLGWYERDLTGHEGQWYLVTRITQPIWRGMRRAILSLPDGTPIYSAPGKPLEVHVLDLEKGPEFLAAVSARLREK